MSVEQVTLAPSIEKRIAEAASVDRRTLRRFLAGGDVRRLGAQRIEAELKRAGIRLPGFYVTVPPDTE